MKNKAFGAAVLALGLLIVLTPRFILPVCEYAGKQRMLCTYTGIAEMFLGGIVLTAGIGVFFSKAAGALGWLMLVAAVSGVFVIVLPGAIGYCKSPSMPCNYGAVPMLRLLGGLLIAVSLTGIIVSKKRCASSR